MKKFFLAFTAMLMAFSVSAAELNIYASGLKAGEVKDGKVEVAYFLNAPATTLEVQLLNADNTVAKSFALTDSALLAKGAHTATLDLAEVAAGTYTWAIKAAAEARTEVSENIIAVGEYDFYRPQGFAVNTNPESPFFGQVYITNAASPSADKAAPYEGADKGIYVYNQLYELQGHYAGGVTWGAPSPFRLFVDEAGLVYASNWGDNGGIYIMDPANPTADFKSLFDPAKRGETYSQITGFDIVGTGADRVLVACDGVNYVSGVQVGAVVKWAIGETNENFAGAADTLGLAKPYTLANNNNTVMADGRGGYWIYQNRGSEATSSTGFQCLIHITADGTMNYSSFDDKLGIVGSNEGAAALNADKTILALSITGGQIFFYDITWAEDGKPVLTKKAWETAALGNKVNGIAWDYANNIVTGTRNTERLGVFALPSENVCTTPASKANTITVEAAAPAGANYVKVTEAPADWTGTYILVYEANADSANVWTGVDATGYNAENKNGPVGDRTGTVAATIANGAISGTFTELEIAAIEGGYSIKILGGDNDGKYIGRTSYSNGLQFAETAIKHTITMDGTNVVLASATTDANNPSINLQFVSAKDQVRFRYYKSAQKAVQLYKKVENVVLHPEYLFITPNYSEVEAGDSILLTLGCEPEGAVLGEITWSLVRGSELATITAVAGTNTAWLKANADLTEGGQVEVKAAANGIETEQWAAMFAITIPVAAPESITITSETGKFEVPALGTLQLTATINPIGEYWYIWEISDDQLATISSTGLVTSLTETGGKVTATAMVEGFEDVKASVEIILLPKDITALENVEADSNKVRKVVEEGKVVIIRNGVKYDTTGAVIEK